MKALFVGTSIGVLLATPPVALGCPDCASTNAARASFWSDPGFVFHLGATAAPFVVLGALVVTLHRRAASSSTGGLK